MKPLVGIRSQDNKFISLLNGDAAFPKAVIIYRGDVSKKGIAILACRRKISGDIEKIYCIGNIRVDEEHLEKVCEGPADISEDKLPLKIVSSMSKGGTLSIKVFYGTSYDAKLLNSFYVNIISELEKRIVNECEDEISRYGDFVKTDPANAFLFPEEDLAEGGLGLLQPDEDGEKQIEEEELPSVSELTVVEDEPEEDHYFELAEKAQNTRTTIRRKLIGIISIIVIAALSSVTFLVKKYVFEDVQRSAQISLFAANRQTAGEIEKQFSQAIDNSILVLSLESTLSSKPEECEKTVQQIFDRDKNLKAVIIPGKKNLYSKKFYEEKNISQETFKNIVDYCIEGSVEARANRTYLQNISMDLNTECALLAFGIEYKDTSGSVSTECVYALVDLDYITDVLQSNEIYSSYAVDSKGKILCSPQRELTMTAKSVRDIPIVNTFVYSDLDEEQIGFEKDGKSYYGAYRVISAGKAGIITVVSRDTVMGAVERTVTQNIYLAIAILAVAVLIACLFAKTISTPIKALTAAAQKIKDGEYDVKIKSHSSDELGLLTESFIQMSQGLAERERLKESFGQFTNKAVAERAARGELELGGENLRVTVFFSNIRSFTAMSETLEPAQVVEFLNEYMTRMVKCVTSTGGFVDKYIGDTIMAAWGAPVSSGTPKEDALNSVRAALMMRAELIGFNKEREDRGLAPVKTGCGINSGGVVAGQIGSTERMEYTCIGDTVNLASRTESLNKSFKTDILITENTLALIRDKVTVEEMPSVKVKGKEEPVKMYAVINMPEEKDIPGAGPLGFTSLDQVRKALGYQDVDLYTVDINEEVKTQA